MSVKQHKYLFIDRDGTIIVEPEDKQIDHVDKLEFLPGVFSALKQLQEVGFKLVMVSNQDGLGTASFPQADFDKPQQMMLKVLKSQQINFDEVLICPHFSQDNCNCRKPKVGLLMPYLTRQVIDLHNSYVIGDRDTDIELAKNLNIKGLKLVQQDDAYGSWADICQQIIHKQRISTINRQTNETVIAITVNLDKAGHGKIDTGIAFFDHMLDQIAKHAGISVDIVAKGDLQVDEHHTVEDVAICLAQAFASALADKYGIARYGFVLPMDDANVQMSLDLSGRFYFKMDANFQQQKLGQLSTEMVSHFFYSFAETLKANLHIKVLGENTHHMVEATFKALGKVLHQAMARASNEMPSTKGVL